jgi:hypothetical protein
MRTLFEFPAENAKITDWLAERGGFKPPVSREVVPKENKARMLVILRVRTPLESFKSRDHPVLQVDLFLVSLAQTNAETPAERGSSAWAQRQASPYHLPTRLYSRE